MNTPNTPMNIAVLGIGLMGWPMAQRLLAAGHHVHAWNRTRAKAERLAPLGAHVHDRAAQAVAQADLVIVLLENGDVVGEVLLDPTNLASLRPGSLVVDMSSIQPRQARAHAAHLQSVGVAHLDAPVSGGTLGAEQGTLAIMVGGEAADVARALPALNALGRTTHVGDHGSGQLAKLANQMIVGITIGAVAEALLLCEKGGADPAKVKAAISGGFADSRVLQVHGQRMVDGDFVKRGSMAVQLKDMRNALSTATALGFEAPITALFEQLFAQGVAEGLAEQDQSALFCSLAQRNGMR
jgi:3-hydroxyisobutyrate dehydrogenase-like beta-hydroxyacid dehydrogenase